MKPSEAPGDGKPGGATPRDGTPGDDAPDLKRGYARMRAADDAARARLEPLAPGERPLVLTVSAALAAFIAVANLILLVSGWQLQRAEQPGLVEALALPVFMLVLAVGLWQKRYWALLVFQFVLALTIVLTFLFLLRAANLEAVLLSVVALAVCGTLFWFLVRVMARVQMPRETSQ